MREESFVFFTSWLEAIEELESDTEKYKAFVSIMKYQAYGTEPEVTGAPKAIFNMAKPIADGMHKRRITSIENGKKGGRPKKEKKQEPKEIKLFEKEEDIYAGYSNKFKEAMNEFKKMRKAMKKPLATEKAEKMLLNKLGELATDEETKIRIIEQSILRGWQSVYPLKEEKQEDKIPVYDASANRNIPKEEEEELLKLIGRS